MTEVIVKIPEDIKSIIGEFDEPLYIEALREIARKKIKEKKKKLNQMKEQIDRFQKRYGASLEIFSRNMPDTQKAHDDWIEWTFLEEAVKELQTTVDKLERLLSQ